MGLSPQKLALTVALGFVIGILPLFGIATLVCTVVGYRLRLNIPALLLISYLAGPLHLLLYLPFIKLGIFIFGADDFRLSFNEILLLFQTDWLGALKQIWLANMLGVVAWLLVSLPVGLLVYFTMKPVFRRLTRRKPLPPQDL